jgi:hypothetical protein
VVIAREWLNFATERVPQMQEEKMARVAGSASKAIRSRKARSAACNARASFYRANWKRIRW